MATATATVPGTDQLNDQSMSLAQKAQGITITDKRSAEAAVAVRNDGKAILKQIGDTFDPLIKQAHEQHKALIATKSKFAGPVEAVILRVNQSVVAYELAQERLRRQEQARLEDEARKDREAQALAEAQELASQGHQEAAEQVVQEAIEASAPVVVVERERIQGASFRSVWEWEITDITKLPLNLLQVRPGTNGNMTEIATTGVGAIVRTMKSQAEKQVPGIRVWERKIAL